MFYCPKCNKKFRQQVRKCPDCGGHCVYKENRNIPWLVTIAILSFVLAALLLTACQLPNILENYFPTSAPASSGNPSSVPSSIPTAPSTVPTDPSSVPTEPSSAPTEPTTPSTVPTQPSTGPNNSGLGIYTREQLEAMDKTYNENGFGAGRAPNHQRPGFPASEQQKYAQYGGLFIGPDDKNVYLTFDCGYEYYATDKTTGERYAVTGRILDVLKEKNVKAVFFITKDYVDMAPDLVQRMVDEGHVVGNHTVYHPVMPSKSIDRMEREVMVLHDLVLEKYGYKMTLFRPPTGAYSIQSLAVVQNLGYKSVLWSFQHLDYLTDNQPSEKTAYDLITQNSHNGCIYLLHAVSETNAAVLGDVIDNLQNEQGYTISLLS